MNTHFTERDFSEILDEIDILKEELENIAKSHEKLSDKINDIGDNVAISLMKNTKKNINTLQKLGVSTEKSLIASLLGFILIPSFIYIGGAIYNGTNKERQKKLNRKQKELASREQKVANKGYNKSLSLLEKFSSQIQKYAITNINNYDEVLLKHNLKLINKYFEYYFNLKKSMIFYGFIKKELELWTLGNYYDDNQPPPLKNIRNSCIYDFFKYSKTNNYMSLGNYFLENNPEMKKLTTNK